MMFPSSYLLLYGIPSLDMSPGGQHWKILVGLGHGGVELAKIIELNGGFHSYYC